MKLVIAGTWDLESVQRGQWSRLVEVVTCLEGDVWCDTCRCRYL